MTCDICISCDFSNSGLCFRCIVRYMLYYDLPCTYYGVCTICWLCDTSSCHCEDSFMFVKKKKKGSSHICFKKTLCKNQNSEVQVLCISPDDVVFRPDSNLCPEALNCSKLHLSERFSNTSGRQVYTVI
jgi:hypothetical protein